MMVRLSAWLLVPLTLLFGAAALWMADGVMDRGEHGLRQRLEGTVEVLALTAGDSLQHSTRLGVLAARRGYERIWFVSAGHRISASSLSAEAGSTLEPRWRALLEGAEDSQVRTSVDWGNRTLLFVAARNDASGTWAVLLYDATSLHAALAGRAVRLLLFCLVVWLAVVALLLFGLHLLFVRPVRQVHDLAQRVAAGEAVPEPTLQRLRAETAPALGALTEVVLDQAREQRAYQESVQEAATLYLALFDLMPHAAFIGSLDGVLLEANRALCNRLGLIRSSILGRPLSLFEALLPVETVLRLARRSHAEGCAFERLDLTFHRPDGQPVPVVGALRAVPFQGVDAFVVVAEDRTEAEALRQQLAAFDDTIELMADERAAAVRTEARRLSEEVAALQPPLEALVRLAEVVGADVGGGAAEDRALLRKAGQRLHHRFEALVAAARALAPPALLPAPSASDEASPEAPASTPD